jgi:hypothetical protein
VHQNPRFVSSIMALQYAAWHLHMRNCQQQCGQSAIFMRIAGQKWLLKRMYIALIRFYTLQSSLQAASMSFTLAQ